MTTHICSTKRHIPRKVETKIKQNLSKYAGYSHKEPELVLRTQVSIQNQQTGWVYVNVLFLDIIIFCNEIISYSNCAYKNVFTVKFLL
jgi:hypothetical protein